MYKCPTCLISRYCSKECYKEDWKEHKKTCKEVEKDNPQIKLSKINLFTIYGMIGETLKGYKMDKKCDTYIFCKITIKIDTFFDYIQGKRTIGDPNSIEMGFHKKDELIKTLGILGRNEVYQDDYYYVICWYKTAYIIGKLPMDAFKKFIYYEENLNKC
jgi:tRNA U34 2-thiouridine synthase MnmA/TrmU